MNADHAYDEYQPERRHDGFGRRATDVVSIELADNARRLTALEHAVSRLATEIEANVTVPLGDLIRASQWITNVGRLGGLVFGPLIRVGQWLGKRLIWLILAATAASALLHRNWTEFVDVMKKVGE